MEKGLLFLTLSAFCLWAILDEFFGGRKISQVAERLAPVDTIDKKLDEAAKKLPDDSLANKIKDRERDQYGPA